MLGLVEGPEGEHITDEVANLFLDEASPPRFSQAGMAVPPIPAMSAALTVRSGRSDGQTLGQLRAYAACATDAVTGDAMADVQPLAVLRIPLHRRNLRQRDHKRGSPGDQAGGVNKTSGRAGGASSVSNAVI